MCSDPLRASAFYVFDGDSIVHVDQGSVSLEVSHVPLLLPPAQAGRKLWHMLASASPSGGLHFFVSDALDCRIFAVNAHTKRVQPLGAYLQQPRCMVFDSCTAVPDSVLYISTFDQVAKLTLAVHQPQILKHVLEPSGVLSEYWLLPELWKTVANYLTTGEAVSFLPNTVHNAHGLAMTPSGTLLMSCTNSHSLYASDLAAGTTLRVAGGLKQRMQGQAVDGVGTAASFLVLMGLAVVPSEQCVFVADFGNGRVRRVLLPPAWLVPGTPVFDSSLL